MKTIEDIIKLLEYSPEFLENLLQSLPGDTIKTRKIKNRWSAHEHACHVCLGDKLGFHKRFTLFKNEPFPRITPLSGADFPEFFYLNQNLDDCLKEFHTLRKKTITMIQQSPDEFWSKKAYHPEYRTYTPFLMLKHLLMHDYFHYYKIEDLLLARD